MLRSIEDVPNQILLIEDNQTTSRTLVLFLASEGYEVTCAFNGREGETRFIEGRFDLVVLDLMLPDMDGLTVCRAIRRSSTVPVVMLSARSSEDEIVEGLECGADDYVCKPFGSRELLARIRLCLNRSGRNDSIPGTHRVGSIVLDENSRVVTVDDQAIRLTRSEFDILRILMRSPGRVYTRDQLIAQALGADFDGFDRTIDTHIWSLRRKIGERRGSPRYILSELGVGYRMNGDHAA